MSNATDSPLDDAVAIIGIAGRFPGADNHLQLWENICNGEESISFMEKDDLDPSLRPDLVGDKDYVRARGMISDAEKFDAAFFGMTPREAQILDPQHKLFLETSWQCFEDAGYNPSTYDGLIGVYAGAGFNNYFIDNVLPNGAIIEMMGRHQVELANAADYLATRISFKLNLKGPSISLYTGCSSSLVAVCNAFDALFGYQCDMALAGGVFVCSPQNSGYLYKQGEIFSADGHTRAFDAKATGTVFSNGAATVLLKRYPEAVEDRDNIYAVIRGAALNNDGSEKASYTAPSIDGQAQVIAMAQANGDVSPDSIAFIEAHGTGTPIGDPIEVAALTKAFRLKSDRKQFCALGSLKANIGHLDAAAGVAGLVKTALALQHRKLPPSLHFDTPNPEIAFEESPFFINDKLLDLSDRPFPLRAGVSSFGVGGTNAHVIVEEAPSRQQMEGATGDRPNRFLLPLSAHSDGSLKELCGNLAHHLSGCRQEDLADIAYTLQNGRTHLRKRHCVFGEDIDTLTEELQTFSQAKQVRRRSDELISGRQIAFIFSGQGSQYVNMGLDLYRQEPVFRKIMESGFEHAEKKHSLDLRSVIYPEKGGEEGAVQQLSETFITQPALFLVEYGMARLMIEKGIEPSYLIGHSIGEYTAACVSGVLKFEDALDLVVMRGRLIQDLEHGQMVAVFQSEEEVSKYLGSEVSLATVNGASMCVLSGSKPALSKITAILEKEGIRFTVLRTSHAFHSHMLEPILDTFKEEVAKYSFGEPKIPFVSNLSGKLITSEEAASPDYWTSHLRNTVRFFNGLETLYENANLLIEVGPGNGFATLAQQHPAKTKEHRVLSCLRHPKEEVSDFEYLFRTCGQIWESSLEFDFQPLMGGYEGWRVVLPTYAFERKRHWLPPVSAAAATSSGEASPQNPGLTGGGVSDAVAMEALDDEDGAGSSQNLTKVEGQLHKIWKNVLGFDELDKDDNYFEIGGSSLMAVRIFDQIEREFDKNLPLATLYDAPTIRGLAKLLDTEDYTPSWSSLVKIQAGEDSQKPIFLMHAEGGNVLEYYTFAKELGPGRTVYGLQGVGLEGTTIVTLSIEEIARHFIEEIQVIQPQGPYLVGGYCLGGLVAFEMAHQLMAAGQEVDKLFLISTSTPDHLRKTHPNHGLFHRMYIPILERALLEFNNFSHLDLKRTIKYGEDRLRRAVGALTFRLESTSEKILKRIGLRYIEHSRDFYLRKSIEVSDDSYMGYEPKELDIEMYLFAVSERTRQIPNDPYLGWTGLAQKGIILKEMTGYHKNILKVPHVLSVAEEVKSLLG